MTLSLCVPDVRVCVCSPKHPRGLMLLLTFGRSAGSAELVRCAAQIQTHSDIFFLLAAAADTQGLHSALAPQRLYKCAGRASHSKHNHI